MSDHTNTHGGTRSGAGRKPGEVTYQNICLALPKEEAKALKELAKADGTSVSRYVSKQLKLPILALERK